MTGTVTRHCGKVRLCESVPHRLWQAKYLRVSSSLIIIPRINSIAKLKGKCALRRETETRTVIAQKLLEIYIYCTYNLPHDVWPASAHKARAGPSLREAAKVRVRVAECHEATYNI